VPPVRIRDNIQLPSTEYRVKLRGTEVARGDVMPRFLLALASGANPEPLEGIRTTDPSFGIPAVWIAPERRIEAEANGYRVVEPQTVLATHLMETVRRHAAELLGRQETKELLDALKQRNTAVVDDTVPAKLSLGALHRVLQRLLRERVPIRDLVTILEAVSDAADLTKDPEQLTEYARRALAKSIARQHQDDGGAIRGIVVGPRLEGALMTLFGPKPQRVGTGPGAALEPDEVARALRTLNDLTRSHRRDGAPPPLITPPALRVGVRRLVEPVLPDLPVLSLGELPPETPIQSLATWELPLAA